MDWPNDAEPLFTMCVRLGDTAQSVFERSIEKGSLERAEVYAAALLARTRLNFRGVTLSARAGLGVEARTIARSCVNNLIWLRRILLDGEAFVCLIKEDSVFHAGSLANAMNAAFSDLTPDELNQLIQPAQEKKGKKAIQTVLPGRIDEAKDHLLFKLFSNDSAHPSALSLARHFRIQSCGKERTFMFEPPIKADEILTTLLAAADAVIKSIAAYMDIVKMSSGEVPLPTYADDLERFVLRYSC